MNKIYNNIIFQLLSILVFGLLLWTAMFIIVAEDAPQRELLVKLGEVGATIALVTTISGVLQIILKKIETQKQDNLKEQEKRIQEDQKKADELKEKKIEKISFYKNILSDFKSVYDRVERARLLIEAHGTAKTYGEQMRELIDGVVTLHNIKRATKTNFKNLEKELKPCIDNMNYFIKGLLNEYRDNYKRISLFQEIDEARKNAIIKEYEVDISLKIDTGKIPSSAWVEIVELDKLKILRDDDEYDNYKKNFKVYLDEASGILRSRIPIEEE